MKKKRTVYIAIIALWSLCLGSHLVWADDMDETYLTQENDTLTSTANAVGLPHKVEVEELETDSIISEHDDTFTTTVMKQDEPHDRRSVRVDKALPGAADRRD